MLMKANAEKMPSFIEPMKALPVEKLPEGNWLYEIKFDGYRALAFKRGQRCAPGLSQYKGVRFLRVAQQAIRQEGLVAKKNRDGYRIAPHRHVIGSGARPTR